MIRRPPRSTQSRSSAASDVYKRQPSDTLRFLKVPPAITNASPNWSTLVLLLVLAIAILSKYSGKSLTSNPNDDILSVTMSDALARSMFPASDNRKIGSRPSIICVVSQPASAIKDNAFADSVALLEVLAPISLALSDSLLKSSPVAPDMAL